MSPLHRAADGGNVDEILQALQSQDVNEVDENGWTPLLYAIWNRRTAATKTLLEKGADPKKIPPDWKKTEPVTALLTDLCTNALEILPLLLAKGCRSPKDAIEKLFDNLPRHGGHPSQLAALITPLALTGAELPRRKNSGGDPREDVLIAGVETTRRLLQKKLLLSQPEPPLQ